MSDAKGTPAGAVPVAARRPGGISLFVAMVTAVILMSLSAVSLQFGKLFFSAVCFVAGSAVLSFLMLFFRSPLICAAPIIAVCVAYSNGAEIFLAAAVVCAATVVSAMYTICNIKKTESFRQFVWCTFAYSVLYGFSFCIMLLMMYGSVTAGFVTLSEQLSALSVDLIAYIQGQGIDVSELAPYIEELMKTAVIYIPVLVCMAGVVSAWFMRGIFSLFTRIFCGASVFNGRQTSAPRSFAVFFLIFSIFGALLSFLSPEILLTVNNIVSVLTLVFMGEGVRLFFASFSRRAATKPKSTLLIVAIALLFFMPQVIILILPYYGAFSVISQNKKRRGSGLSK